MRKRKGIRGKAIWNLGKRKERQREIERTRDRALGRITNRYKYNREKGHICDRSIKRQERERALKSSD